MPVVTVTGAMLLVPVCVGWLIYFIYHISNAISVNHIVDRIRRETELVIDELMPEQRRPFQNGTSLGEFSVNFEYPIKSRHSGYVRFINIDRLRALAKAYRICLGVERRVGHFIPEGVILLKVSGGDRVTRERELQLLAAIDIGPTRTMQQDIEFGIVQIVDIGLKAISPAVNDPTTAISCVDQLTCILIRWLGHIPPAGHFYDPPYVLRVVVPWTNFNGLFDLAFEQIRHYSVSDAAVSLRLMRAFTDIASTVDEPAIRLYLLDRGKELVAGCKGHLQVGDFERLAQRLLLLESEIAPEI